METEARLSQSTVRGTTTPPWKSMLEKPVPGSLDFQTLLQDWEDSSTLHGHILDATINSSTSPSDSDYSATTTTTTTSVADSSLRFDGFPSLGNFPPTPPSPEALVPPLQQQQQSKLFPDPKPKPNLILSSEQYTSPTSTLSSPFGTTPCDFLVPLNCDAGFAQQQQQIPSPSFWSQPSLTPVGENNSFLSLPEILLELPEAAPKVSVSAAPAAGWASQYGYESKDYWTTMLNLVGTQPHNNNQLLTAPQ